MRFLRPLWLALRNAAIATAIFWVTLYVVQNSDLGLPAEVAQLLVFFAIFVLGVLVTRRG